jgi:hypothetical protein
MACSPPVRILALPISVVFSEGGADQGPGEIFERGLRVGVIVRQFFTLGHGDAQVEAVQLVGVGQPELLSQGDLLGLTEHTVNAVAGGLTVAGRDSTASRQMCRRRDAEDDVSEVHLFSIAPFSAFTARASPATQGGHRKRFPPPRRHWAA